MNGERENMILNREIRLMNSKRLACLLILLLLLNPVTAKAALMESQEKITYIALGDSLTAGIGASETGYLRLTAFVPRLTNYLRQSLDVYVENHGIPGLTSAQLFYYLTQGPGMKEKIATADLITITIGGNDLLQLVANQNMINLEGKEIEAVFEQVMIHIDQSLRFIQAHNAQAEIYIMDLYSPFDQHHPFHLVSKQVITSFNNKLYELAEEHVNVKLVTVYDLFLNQGSKLTHIEHQDIHPNDQGYDIIFEAFRKSIVQ